jgi:PKD repeat protein
MNKHYNTKWLSDLMRGMLLSASLLLVSGLAMAQLNGTYTIDSATATGGTNFQSFVDLADSLKANGVSGPVTVNVVASSGPYKQEVVLPAASGTSATNTITINGNGEKVWTDQEGPVILIDSASYYTLSNLAVENQTTDDAARCIQLRGEANYNTIEDCDLTITKYTGKSSRSGYIFFSASTTNRSSGLHGSYNVIDGNTMSNGNNTGVGPYYGIAYYGGSSGVGIENEYTNNDVQDFFYYGLYSWYGEDMVISDNKVHDSRSDANDVCGIFVSGLSTSASGQCEINGNEVYDLENNVSWRRIFGIYSSGCNGGTSNPFEIVGNDIHDIEALTSSSIYGIYKAGGSNGLMQNNEIHNGVTESGTYYGIFGTSNSTDVTDGNAIYDNETTGTWNSLYAIYHSNSGGIVRNNLIVGNETQSSIYGYYNSWNLPNDVELAHNTIIIDKGGNRTNAGIYFQVWTAPTNDADIVNNIIEMSSTTGTLYSVFGGNSYADYFTCENNDIYTNTTRTVYYGSFNTSTLAGFNTALNTTSNIDVDPRFGKGTYIPANPNIANYGLAGYASHDMFGTTRTSCGPDLGIAEFHVDHSAGNLVFAGTSECSGYAEEVKLDVTNGVSEDLKDLKVYYSIDGGTPVVEEIAEIKAGATESYTFNSVPVFNGNGNMTLEVGLLCDDNDANNTLTHVIDIKPAPHSFKLSQGPTFNGYYEDGSMVKPDVTVPGQVIEYNVDNPARFANGDYDTEWELVEFAITENGTVTTGVDLKVKPSTGVVGVLEYDPDPSMADSLVFVGFTVTDKDNGCDSTFGRWVYVPHTPVVAWSAANGCDGDIVPFVNNTTQGTGATEYMWDFGDPASGADNTSTISDPVHRFTTYGTYTINVTAWNFDYPKFTYSLSKQIEVYPVPMTNFAVKNACEGVDIEFTNGTTLPAGITGTIDYIWNFGDGSANSNALNPTHLYANPGGYKVTLSASLNGCVSTITKNANQFATPVADFTVDGKCNLEDVQFNNGSTIALGSTGYAWDFNDGGVSNLSNPTHSFTDHGDHKVRLTAVSEFGCTDFIEKTFTLNESPKADFDFTDPCSETEIEFTRTGSLPDPGTITSIFEWDFDGERISTRENDKHKFASVGVKKVTLKVSSDNFCSDEITKEFVVKLQAKADFIANDVCDGDEVVFTNKSSVAAGNLEYLWKFADNNTSQQTSPRHLYTLQDPDITEEYQVTLLALVPGGCSDSIAKTVTVNAKPDADFTIARNGRQVDVTPIDQNNAYQYFWRFGEGGKSEKMNTTYRYKVDVDSFDICLAVINSAGCISEECRKVKIDLVGLDDLNAQDIFNVYPNPNAGVFNVTVNDPESNVNIVIMDATGKTIKTIDADASGKYQVDISDVAAGVYMVQVINGNYAAMQRVTVAN